MKNRTGRTLLFLALGGILFSALIIRGFSADAFEARWDRLQLAPLLAAVLLGLLTTQLRAWRYQLLVPVASGRRLELYGAFASMRFLNFVFPFKSGELIFLALLKKMRLAPGVLEILPAWGIIRVMDVCILALLSAGAAWINPVDSSFQSLRTLLPPTALTALLGLVILLTVSDRLPDHLIPAKLRTALDAVRRGIQQVRRGSALAGCAVLSLLVWTAMGGIVALAHDAFGGPLSAADAFGVGILLLAFSMLPIHPPLGLGTADAALAGLLILAGLPEPEAIALALSIRILLVGIVCLDGLLGSALLILFQPSNAMNTPLPEQGQDLQREYYAREAEGYDAACFGNRDNRSHTAKIMRIRDLLNPEPGMNILEVGAGTGIHGLRLRALAPGIHYTGMDLSPEMIDIARRRLGPDVNLFTGPAESLPFDDEHFDGVFCCATLHHLADRPKGLAEMIRVLKPGGSLVMSEPNPVNPLNIRQWMFIPAERGQLDIRTHRIRGWLKDAGARLVFVQPMNYTPPGPEKLAPLLNNVDRTLARVPVLRRISSVLIFHAVREPS